MAVMERLAPLDWRRPVKDILATGTKRRSWLSRCGRFRLEERRGGGTMWLSLARDVAGIRVYWRQLACNYAKQAVLAAIDRFREEDAAHG
jgi:hypothetical protein